MNQIFGNYNSTEQHNKTINNNNKIKDNYNANYNYYQNDNAFYDINKHIDNYQAEQIEMAKFQHIMKIFCITIILFGIFIMGKSTYALTFGRPKPRDNVEVSVDKMGKEITIKIETLLPIKEYSYRWNDGTEMKKIGNGTVSISEVIDVPNGNNILKISVIDNYGNKTEYQKQYVYESQDTQKPSIKFEIAGTKLKIIATDDQKMKYMTYQWSDEEPTRIDAVEVNQKEIVEEIEVSRGKEKLTIIAVDGEDNKETVTKTILGAKKPTFTLETEESNLIIKAQDESNIKSVKVIIDGEEEVANDINQKEIEAKIGLEAGEHNISVTVTNVDDQELTKELEVNI